MEFEFLALRRDLDSLGYFQTLSYESVPLVGKLFRDLKTTTTNLQKYMKIAQNVIKEKENLELSTGLHKTDSSKLVKEFNDLQLSHLNYRSQTEKEIKEFKNRIFTLNEENRKLVLENDELRKNVHDTELDLMKSLRPTGKTNGNNFSKCKTNCLSSDGELIQENLEMKHELNELKKELKNLQCQCNHLDPEGFEISPKESDILTERHSQDKVFRLLDEVRNLTREKNELDKSYKEALAKQHEAMRRAIHLAERNRELEKELKDIDQMAIAVEEECNDAVNDRTRKLTRVELALRDALLEIQKLEKTISSMKKEKWESELNDDIGKTETKQLHEMSGNNSNNVNDQLNNMKIIEQDLNLEIDRLVQENAEQKQMIAEMESKLVAAQAAQTVTSTGPGGDGISSAKKKSKDSLHLPPTDTAQTDFSKILESSTQTGAHFLQTETDRPSACAHFKKPLLSCVCGVPNRTRCCTEQATLTDAFRNGCCKNMCLQHFQDLVRKEIERCRCEISGGCSRCPKIQQKLNFMQQENKRLSQEKITLMARLEATRDDNEIFRKCDKALCKRTQRERDLFKADVARLEEESECLRENLKELCEAKKIKHESLRQQIYEYESRLKKIECERSELMNSQNTRTAQINAIDKKNEFLEEMLRNSQDDLKNQKVLYIQLKALHNQTDKALFNTQTQLNQLEQELASARKTIDILKKPKIDDNLRSAEVDLDSMKKQLNKLDREKDDLLNIVDSKTEEIETLRKNLKSKCELIETLKAENNDWRGKFGNVSDRATASCAFLKESEVEICRLQKLLEETYKTRDNALKVNRNLQEELATISGEAISLKKQLSNYQEQTENLKLQSQQYIAEVKRAEDLLQNKEKEREDLLNQFKQLCKESNNLQSNNHVLESEASQSKVQLSVAMDHVTNLEQRSETLEILIGDYEKQIGLLTNQIAKFESERNQHLLFQERTETELRTLRELCMKLDKEKEHLRLQMMDSGRSEDKISELLQQNQVLTTKLTDAANKLANAEKLLSIARHEGVELKIKNEDTIVEIQFLKEKIADLEQRLATASQEVDRFQEKALEYSNQIRQLRRQITNERFHNSARGDGDRFPSLVHCSCKVCSKKCSTGLDICEKNCLEAQNKDNAVESLVSQTFDKSSLFNARPDKLKADALLEISHLSESTSVDETEASETLSENSEISSSTSVTSNDKYSIQDTPMENLKLTPNMASAPSSSKADKLTRPSIGGTLSNSHKKNIPVTQVVKDKVTKSICRSGKCYPDCKMYNPTDKICNKLDNPDKVILTQRLPASQSNDKNSSKKFCSSS